MHPLQVNIVKGGDLVRSKYGDGEMTDEWRWRMKHWKRKVDSVGSRAPEYPDRTTSASDRMSLLQWIDPDHLQVGDTSFTLSLDPATWSAASTVNRFLLLKTRRMIESFVAHVPDRVDNIVDLGIFKGGSIALYNELFSPRHIVGVDSVKRREEALDRYVAKHSLKESVHLYYGTDQADQERLTDILRVNFGDEALDLVIDDCSHMYELTKASLNILFPRLRPGGVYVIEDWAWAHWSDEYWQGSTHQYTDERTPLSKLILELVMVAASWPGLISEITVRSAQVYLTRGEDLALDAGLDVSGSYLSGGRQMLH